MWEHPADQAGHGRVHCIAVQNSKSVREHKNHTLLLLLSEEMVYSRYITAGAAWE